jgi:hypothetical protein
MSSDSGSSGHTGCLRVSFGVTDESLQMRT